MDIQVTSCQSVWWGHHQVGAVWLGRDSGGKICDFFGGKQRGLTNIENNCWASTCSTKRHVFSILSKKSRSMLVRQFSTHTSMTWVYLPFETLRGRGFVWEKVLSIQRIGKWNSQWYKTAFLARSCGRLHFCLKRESTWDDVVGYTCIQICSWGWTRSYLVGGADDDSPENHWQDVQAKSDEPWRRHEEGIWRDKTR